MQSITTFISHLHPVLVHLPIGLILAALLLQALSKKEKYASLRIGVPVVLLAGVVSAVLSCITGLLLASGGDYDPALVSWHRWMGLSLTALSLVIYLRLVRKGVDRTHQLLSLVLLVLLLITGHLGGSLTHGSDYLTGPLTGRGDQGFPLAADTPLANVQEARAYGEIIRPILQNNCYSCHGPSKQKGGLRMDAPDALMKGGKDGVVILPGNGNGSELIKRLVLPAGDEHHMPPKEKRPLNERQLALIHWWIDQGADLSRKVKEMQQPDSVRPALLSLQHARSHRSMLSDVPTGAVEAAGTGDIEALRSRGIFVMPLAQNSNWLEVEFPTATDSLVHLLLPIRRQLVSLKLDNTNAGDSALAILAGCKALRTLGLSGTRVTDKGIAALRSLDSLRVLNLVGTAVTAGGILPLNSLRKLRSLYLYRTGVAGKDWPALKKAFPSVLLDSGGYSIPFIPTDTQVVQPPKPPVARK
jgi:uncharacterized membrane protein/mono/diheme cytochrome c family protein